MASEFGYFLTRRAEGDLDEILSYLPVQLSAPKAAADFLEKLQGAIREACAFPESGAPVDNAFLPNGTVRKKLVGSDMLYYFPDREDERIYILRILYGRRNLDELLREMDLN